MGCMIMYTVGQKVYLLISPMSSCARGLSKSINASDWILEQAVASVSRSRLVTNTGESFEIDQTQDSMMHNNIYTLYPSFAAAEEAYLRRVISHKLNSLVTKSNWTDDYSYDTLERIYSILLNNSLKSTDAQQTDLFSK